MAPPNSVPHRPSARVVADGFAGRFELANDGLKIDAGEAEETLTTVQPLWQPLEARQWISVLPHHPYSEQQPPKLPVESHVAPPKSLPQRPSGRGATRALAEMEARESEVTGAVLSSCESNLSSR